MTEPHLADVEFAPVQSPDLGRARNVSRLLARSVPGRNLGRLADIGAWVAGVQGARPRRSPTRARSSLPLATA